MTTEPGGRPYEHGLETDGLPYDLRQICVGVHRDFLKQHDLECFPLRVTAFKLDPVCGTSQRYFRVIRSGLEGSGFSRTRSVIHDLKLDLAQQILNSLNDNRTRFPSSKGG
jgi:hypothetical protein